MVRHRKFKWGKSALILFSKYRKKYCERHLAAIFMEKS